MGRDAISRASLAADPVHRSPEDPQALLVVLLPVESGPTLHGLGQARGIVNVMLQSSPDALSERLFVREDAWFSVGQVQTESKGFPASADGIGIQALHVIEEGTTYQPRFFRRLSEPTETCSLRHFAEHVDGDRLLADEVPAVIRRVVDGIPEGSSNPHRPAAAEHIDWQCLLIDHCATLVDETEVAQRRHLVFGSTDNAAQALGADWRSRLAATRTEQDGRTVLELAGPKEDGLIFPCRSQASAGEFVKQEQMEAEVPSSRRPRQDAGHEARDDAIGGDGLEPERVAPILHLEVVPVDPFGPAG